MTKATLTQILNQLETLELEELQQLNQTIQKYLIDKEKQAVFHQLLIDAGLVKQIQCSSYEPITERRLIQVEGKPVSETIIEERR